jgi:hypothetical protein
MAPNLRLPPNLRLTSNRNLKTRSDKMTRTSNLIGDTRARTIRSSRKMWRRNARPPRENLGRCRNKTLAALYLRGTKILDPSDGFWVGLEMEVFKALYLGGSDGFDIS